MTIGSHTGELMSLNQSFLNLINEDSIITCKTDCEKSVLVIQEWMIHLYTFTRRASYFHQQKYSWNYCKVEIIVIEKNEFEKIFSDSNFDWSSL